MHKAQLVVTCCRLKVVAEWSVSEMCLDAGRVVVPERDLDRLGAAGRGQTVVSGALESALRHIRRASTPSTKKEFGCDPRTLAERCYSNKLTGSDAAQLVYGLCNGLIRGVALVAAIDPCPCRSSTKKSKGGGVELWARVGQFFVVDATCHKQPPRRPAYLVEYSPAGEGGSLVDVTAEYYESPESKLLPKAARRDWWRSRILHSVDFGGLVNGSASASSSSSRRLPTNRAAFRDHEMYALRSTLSKRQKLDEGAKQIGLFKGEPVYGRSDVLPLRTAREWRRRFRRVRQEEEMDEDSRYPLYLESQTEPWEPDPVGRDGSLPVNDYGDVDVYDGDSRLVPRGAVWFKGKQAREVARNLSIRYAPVMTGWEKKPNNGASFSNRDGHRPAVRPKRDGIVVAEKDAASLRTQLYDHARAQQQASRRALLKKAQGRWTRLVTRMLTRDRLRAEYDDDSLRQ